MGLYLPLSKICLGPKKIRLSLGLKLRALFRLPKRALNFKLSKATKTQAYNLKNKDDLRLIICFAGKNFLKI